MPSGCVGPFWAWTEGNHTAELLATLKDECGNLLAWSKYDRNTYNQEAARSMVQYASTADGQIPYGMTDEEALPVYEYVFNFPADAEILKGHDGANSSNERVCGISIALPAFEGWNNMEVVVYGEMWDPTANSMAGAWRPGIIRKLMNIDNAEFKLDQLKLWKTSMRGIPTVTARIDDNYFYQQTELRVATTQDLYNLIDARLTEATNTQNISFEVQHYGNGLEITDEVVDLIKTYEKDNEVKVAVKFNNVDLVQTPVIFKSENAIEMFEYNGVNVIVEAPQAINSTVNGIWELRNFSQITLNAGSSISADKLYNEEGAVLTANNAKVDAEVHNDGELYLDGSDIAGSLFNHAAVTTTGSSSITGIVNYNNCVNCGKSNAKLIVKSGELTVSSKLSNYDLVEISAGATLSVNILDNLGGEMAVSGEVGLTNTGTNKAVIKIADCGFVEVVGNTWLENLAGAKIYVEGKLAENIKNSGEVFVVDDGQVIVNGVVDYSGIIDVTDASGAANDAQKAMDKTTVNHFRYMIKSSITSVNLESQLKERISSRNINDNLITVVFSGNGEMTYSGTFPATIKIYHVVVENGTELVLDKNTRFATLSNTCGTINAYKAFEVKGGAKVVVSDGTQLWLDGNPEVWVDGVFNANDNSILSGKAVVKGTGEFWLSTKYYDWELDATDWNGKAYGW